MKGVIKSSKPKKDKQMTNRKRTNNNLQYTTQKTKDRITRTLLQTGNNLGAPEGK